MTSAEYNANIDNAFEQLNSDDPEVRYPIIDEYFTNVTMQKIFDLNETLVTSLRSKHEELCESEHS